MKEFLVIFPLLCFTFSLVAQRHAVSERADDLKKQLSAEKEDTTKWALLNALFMEYLFSYPDSSANYCLVYKTKFSMKIFLQHEYLMAK